MQTPSAQPVRSFHLMVKPVGSRCNLDCTYCYYQEKDRLLSDTLASMSDEILEKTICQGIAGHEADTVLFTWHGGEPTLLGLVFFRRVVELEQKYAGGKRIDNDLQTNGLLLDDAWCRFLKEHDFLVGLSIDGPKHLHDPFRKSKTGESSFEQVCRAARLLQDHGVTFNTLTVVNSLTARHPADVYSFLTEELGARRLQWLPCVEPTDFRTTAPRDWDAAAMPILGSAAARPGQPDSVVTDWSVDPDDWGDFLCQTFDLWVKNDVGKVLVNWFESLVGQWLGQPAQLCTLAEVCGRSLALEKDGSLYPCDHFVYPECSLGNVNDKSRPLVDMVYSLQQRRFGCAKRETLTEHCKQCEYSFACNGGCPKDRFLKSPDGQPGLNYLCSGTKCFLAHADPKLRQIVVQLQQRSIVT
jgi:uncharacterized protein